MNLGIVMDPISAIKPEKDSSLAMLLAAQRRDWQLHYMESSDLYWYQGKLCARLRAIQVYDDSQRWYQFGAEQNTTVDFLDLILMRKDPPLNLSYIHTTLMLEMAQEQGTPVYNDPRALRDVDEKLFITRFGQCIAPTMVGRSGTLIREFAATHGKVVLKPLRTMGGSGVFHSHARDPNLNVIIETLTNDGKRDIMVQQYIEAAREGDTRILLIDGEPLSQVLVRIPGADDPRGNLVRGARGEGRTLSARERRICAQIGPVLRKRGIVFCGLDVIGDYLTEINVTSPTCIRELDACFGLDIADQLLTALESRLASTP